MDGPDAKTNHSAEVDIWMDCASGRKFRLLQVSNQFVMADASVTIPAGIANIIVTVDGRSYERRVRLLHDVSPSRPYGVIEPYEDVPV